MIHVNETNIATVLGSTIENTMLLYMYMDMSCM